MRPKSLSDLTSLSGLFGKYVGGFARQFFQRDRVSVWNLSWLKDIFQVLDQLLILSRSADYQQSDMQGFPGNQINN